MLHPLTLCLAVAGVTMNLGMSSIELRWRHSVEHSLWTEEWQATNVGLVSTAATIEGSGAGMEPPDDAIRTRNGWTWRPHLPPLPELELARSGATDDWQVCRDGICATIEALTGLPADGRPARLSLCPDETAGMSGSAPTAEPSRTEPPVPATETRDDPGE